MKKAFEYVYYTKGQKVNQWSVKYLTQPYQRILIE